MCVGRKIWIANPKYKHHATRRFPELYAAPFSTRSRLCTYTRILFLSACPHVPFKPQCASLAMSRTTFPFTLVERQEASQATLGTGKHEQTTNRLIKRRDNKRQRQHSRVCKHTHTYKHVYVRMNTHTRTFTHTCTQTPTRNHTCDLYAHVQTRICLFTRAHMLAHGVANTLLKLDWPIIEKLV